jgi:hypothetical protein
MRAREKATASRPTEPATSGSKARSSTEEQRSLHSGTIDESRALTSRRLETCAEMGLTALGLFVRFRTANHDLIAGDAESAEHEARIAYDELTRLEGKSWRGTAVATLGAVLAALHCYDEALNYSQIGENIGAPDDVINEI